MKYNGYTLFFFVVLFGLLLVSFAKRTNPTHTEVVGAQTGIHTNGISTWGGFGGWPNHPNEGSGGGN
ncbi:hypothetical protein R6Q59_008689 [Mikania micrantha]